MCLGDKKGLCLEEAAFWFSSFEFRNVSRKGKGRIVVYLIWASSSNLMASKPNAQSELLFRGIQLFWFPSQAFVALDLQDGSVSFGKCTLQYWSIPITEALSLWGGASHSSLYWAIFDWNKCQNLTIYLNCNKRRAKNVEAYGGRFGPVHDYVVKKLAAGEGRHLAVSANQPSL